MAHRIEISPSGRAACKTCGKAIAKGELRLGEEYASQFGSDGAALRWHHLACGAQSLPAVLRAAMDTYAGDIPNRAELDAVMNNEAKTPKKVTSGALPTADLAPTSRAKCIQCNATIAKGSVRIAVEREIDTGSFATKAAGYLHPQCAQEWAAQDLEDFIAQVQANTALDALPPPFGATNTQSTETPAPTQKTSPKPKAKPANAVPDFGALSGKKISALAEKLAPLNNDSKADSVFNKSKIDWGERSPLSWHMAAYGLLPPSHPAILNRLGESALDASAELVFAVLPKIGKPPRDWAELSPGWPFVADAIALRAFQLDRARLEALVESVPRPVRTGIQLVRGRHGASVPEADRSAVLAGLARAEAHGYGISRTRSAHRSWLSMKALGDDGKITEPYGTVFDLARHFGSTDAWLDALADACRGGHFDTIEWVTDGLARLPLSVMVAVLAKKSFSSDAAHDRRLAALLEARNDAPEALIEAALAIDREDYPGNYLREDILVLALAKLETLGRPAPAGIEDAMGWERIQNVWSPWRDFDVMRAAYRNALNALGPTRTLALAQKRIDRGYNRSQSVTFLGVHYDETMVREVLAGLEDYADYALFAVLGTKALPLFVEAMEADPPKGSTREKRRSILRRAIQGVVALEARAGRVTDEVYDKYLSCETDESYWQEELKKSLVEALGGLSEARRETTLDRLFAETKQPERAFYGVFTVQSLAYRERAARVLVKRFGEVIDRATLQLGLQALGPHGLAAFRAAVLTENPDPKVFQELARAFGENDVKALREACGVTEEKPLERLLRLARERVATGASSTRIYLLERANHEDLGEAVSPPRPGSFSRARGEGAGDRATLGLGEREHVITVDLEEIPELKEFYPNARALALYADNPDFGDAWQDAMLVELSAETPAPQGGNVISLVPVEVPHDIFDYEIAKSDPVLKELRGLVFNRPGYALGEPMFIQEGDCGGTFIMQIAEQIADLNLGDSGSLYVFDDTVFMQCY